MLMLLGMLLMGLLAAVWGFMMLLARPMGQTHRSHRRLYSSLDVSWPETGGSDSKAG